MGDSSAVLPNTTGPPVAQIMSVVRFGFGMTNRKGPHKTSPKANAGPSAQGCLETTAAAAAPSFQWQNRWTAPQVADTITAGSIRCQGKCRFSTFFSTPYVEIFHTFVPRHAPTSKPELAIDRHCAHHAAAGVLSLTP